MRLPAIPFLTKTVSTEFFLSLIFESDKISSILFKEQEKTLIILASHEVLLDLEDATVEDLVVASDKVISKLELSLPENATLEKTIFAVPHSWVEEGKIKPERLTQLKKISVELALTPMGFIVSIEAIIAFLQKKEGAPVNGIFVELSEKYLTVFIVRGGNVIDVKHGMVEDGVETTVEKLLGEVTSLDVLPSKIVLLHNKESENIQQKFLSHHWTKDLPFMHLPQVAILERGFENEAIISGVATQLNVSLKGDVAVATSEEIGEDEEELTRSNDLFGFVKDADVAEIAEEKEPVPETPKKSGEFDFAEEVNEKPIIVKHHGVEQSDDGEEQLYEEDSIDGEARGGAKGRSGAGILSMVSELFTPSSFAKIPRIFGSGRKLAIPLIALIAVIGVIVLYYMVFLKTDVIVFTDKKAFTQDSLDITLTTSGDSSFSDKTLKISTLNEEVQGEESQETTGQKDTGQKATGTITIFNKTEQPKQIEKGTTVVSSNNLSFTLNDSVSIASTSSFSTSFSNVQAKVTAANFGKEYNLPSSTNFTVKGTPTSDLFGRNDSAFSGGTKEEVQVVSKKDLQGLENTVTKRLFEKASSQATAKLQGDEAMVPSYLTVDFKEKKFDKKENDEAKNVKLTATVEYTLGVYKKEELSKFISTSNNFNVPADFKLSESDSTIQISDIQQNKKDISAKLSFNAVFKPQLDVSKIPQLIAGKSEKDAIAKLKSVSGISDVTVVFPNKLPYLPLITSLNKGNIKVVVKTQ